MGIGPNFSDALKIWEMAEKKYPKSMVKIPIFAYRTRLHLGLTSKHSKSCRGLIFVDSIQFLGQTDIIIRHHHPFKSYKKIVPIIRLDWKFASILRLNRVKILARILALFLLIYARLYRSLVLAICRCFVFRNSKEK